MKKKKKIDKLISQKIKAAILRKWKVHENIYFKTQAYPIFCFLQYSVVEKIFSLFYIFAGSLKTLEIDTTLKNASNRMIFFPQNNSEQ